jgi:hypothetical protein
VYADGSLSRSYEDGSLFLSYKAIIPRLYTDVAETLFRTRLRAWPTTKMKAIACDISHGKQVAQHLRKLSNTQRGCPAASLRAAVI